MEGMYGGDQMEGRYEGDQVEGRYGGDQVEGRYGGDQVKGRYRGDKDSPLGQQYNCHRHATRQGTAREGHGSIHFTQREHTGVTILAEKRCST